MGIEVTDLYSIIYIPTGIELVKRVENSTYCMYPDPETRTFQLKRTTKKPHNVILTRREVRQEDISGSLFEFNSEHAIMYLTEPAAKKLINIICYGPGRFKHYLFRINQLIDYYYTQSAYSRNHKRVPNPGNRVAVTPEMFQLHRASEELKTKLLQLRNSNQPSSEISLYDVTE